MNLFICLHLKAKLSGVLNSDSGSAFTIANSQLNAGHIF